MTYRSGDRTRKCGVRGEQISWSHSLFRTRTTIFCRPHRRHNEEYIVTRLHRCIYSLCKSRDLASQSFVDVIIVAQLAPSEHDLNEQSQPCTPQLPTFPPYFVESITNLQCKYPDAQIEGVMMPEHLIAAQDAPRRDTSLVTVLDSWTPVLRCHDCREEELFQIE